MIDPPPCGATKKVGSLFVRWVRILGVVVLGDSLAVTPSMAESFPAVLETRIAGGSLPWTVTNASVSGDTTADGMSRYTPLLQHDVGVHVLELGANDGL